MLYHNKYMSFAIQEALIGIVNGDGGPFGCVIVKDGKIVGSGHNKVIKTNDVTAHGEMEAIRDACNTLGTFDLSGCELYTTHFPCPMCAGAIKWANIKKVYYGCTVDDTANIGFRDKEFYENECIDYEQVDKEECLSLSEEYINKEHIMY